MLTAVRSASRFVLLAVAFLDPLRCSEAEKLEKVWDFRTNAILGIRSRTGSPGVFALGFSGDGRRIAVLVGNSCHDESVLIADSKNPHILYGLTSTLS